MSGPLIVSSGGSGHQIASTVKAAVAALYPKNVVFFNTVSPADPWVSGTGKQGTTTADGNADWVRGPDNSHPTIEGVAYLATRIVRAMSGAIKTLIDAQ